MTARLDGTAALVTGASSGIGEATALALAAEGAAVVLVARRTDRLETLSKQIADDGGRAAVITADISDEEQARDAVGRAAEAFGRLDTVVNNAGVMLLGPALDAPVEEWRRMVDLNVLGLLYCTHAAMPHLLRAAEDGPRGVADLVNISSVAADRAARQRRLQRDQARRRRVQRVAAAGGHAAARARVAGGAGRDRDRARRPQPPEVLEGLRQRFSAMERLQARTSRTPSRTS
jgi:NAD(P)-dependent dehydrogenase (short-subunit alcohol dehydrogenase family)